MRNLLFILLCIFIPFSTSLAKTKPTLLIYCGITMVQPIKEIAKIIEKNYDCTIKISQGGSKDLYDSLKYSKKGDLYVPGSSKYREKYQKDGYLTKYGAIGYNQAAIFVQKNNPKNIKNLQSLLDKSILTMLCNPKSGSIGKQGKSVIVNFGGEEFFEDAFDLTAQIGTDSRNINKALIDKKIDMAINWKATGMFYENKPYITIIDIDEKYVPKNIIEINLLSFSKHTKIATAFIDYAISKDGQKIMQKYGFLD